MSDFSNSSGGSGVSASFSDDDWMDIMDEASKFTKPKERSVDFDTQPRVATAVALEQSLKQNTQADDPSKSTKSTPPKAIPSKPLTEDELRDYFSGKSKKDLQDMVVQHMMKEINAQKRATMAEGEYEFVRHELERIAQKNKETVPPKLNARRLLIILEEITENYRKNFELYEIPLRGDPKEMQTMLISSRTKISEALQSYQQRVEEAEQNVTTLAEDLKQCAALTKEYKIRNNNLTNALIQLRRSETVPGETPLPEQFLRVLEEHMEKDVHLNSTLQEELAVERRTKHDLLQEICRLKEQLVLAEQERQKDLSEQKEYIAMEMELWGWILENIRTLFPQKDDYTVNQAAFSWMEEIRSRVDSMKSEIQQAQRKIANTQYEAAEVKKKIYFTKDYLQKANDEMANLKTRIDDKKETFERLRRLYGHLNTSIRRLEARVQSPNLSSTVYHDAQSTPGSVIQSPETIPEFPKPPPRKPKSAQWYIFKKNLTDTPEIFREGSPYLGMTHFDDSNSMSIHTTPRSALSPYSVTPPSPFDMETPLRQSYGESGIVTGILGTIPMPETLSKLAPRTATVSPSTQNHVTNRFEIGKSFNMHTVCQTSTPYHQVTRVESSIPGTGYSGEIINHPLSITHSAEITPPQYETPVISRSRFGYTDPTARVLNMPPGLVIPAPLLDQGASPDVETYGVPPAVTPTSTRRHGLFTPKGIFRKKHYNIRRIYEPEDYQSPELPWSPQYLPDDGRSPISSLPASDLYSDQTSSRKNRLCSPCDRRYINTTFGSSPVLDRTYDATTLHDRDNAFGAITPRALDRTFYAPSPEALYGTQDVTTAYTSNRTFDASPMGNLSRTFDAQPSYNLNRTFDAQPSHNLNRTFDASSPLPLKETYETSIPRALNKTFDASQPLLQNRTFEARESNNLDRTFDAPSHVMNRTFQTSPATQSMNRTFDETLESLFHVPYRRPIQTGQTATLDTPFTPDRIFDVSHTNVLNETFDEIR